MKRLEYVAALRELADYVESHEFPESKTGYWGSIEDTFKAPNLEFDVRNREDFVAFVRAMGSFEKERDSYSTGAKFELPSGTYVKVETARENVCKKIVVGKRTVEAQPERILAAIPEHEEDVVEWECPESFLNLDQKENANV